MSRKEAILNIRQILVIRRDALRKALAGDLSLLKELNAQTSGDMVDAALDSVQDEISSQLAEVESRELARIEYAMERMREGQFGICEGCGTGDNCGTAQNTGTSKSSGSVSVTFSPDNCAQAVSGAATRWTRSPSGNCTTSSVCSLRMTQWATRIFFASSFPLMTLRT